MKAFVIAIATKYSMACATRCVESAALHGLEVKLFEGIGREDAIRVMEDHGLKWTWAENNTKKTTCPITGLAQFPYTTADLRARIGCAMSHFALWSRCVAMDESILVLEHDSVFLRPLPVFDFKGLCMINDPAGATRRGHEWSRIMRERGTEGVHEKTWVTAPHERNIPDGLAGNSAYLVKPFAAAELIEKYRTIGVWPNDATMCKQLFPYLEEYYPFVTRVRQTISTTSS
jgi:GR25 family glycosyltransferase involved in LPS biosynthesis